MNRENLWKGPKGEENVLVRESRARDVETVRGHKFRQHRENIPELFFKPSLLHGKIRILSQEKKQIKKLLIKTWKLQN